MNVVVVVPSRGRPERAAEAIEALSEHAVLSDTSLILAVDRNDPEYERYGSFVFHHGPKVWLDTLKDDETGDLVQATNTVSLRVAAEDPTAIIGNLGDDHLVRTPGWDRLVTDALQTPGVAYGNDLIHNQNLPTAPFISASIVNALGWYALPTCRHLWIDHAWKDIGLKLGALRYIPELVTEHVHPLVGKAVWDEGYRLANSQETIDHDQTAYNDWYLTRMPADIERIREALVAA